jgi:hypothetical protein
MPSADAVVVAVVGSRDYPRLDLVRAYVATLQPGDTLITGDAGGVDSAAYKTARARRDLHVVRVTATWETDTGERNWFGGYERNPDIITPAEETVAFWDGSSHGTADSIMITIEQGKTLTVLGPDGTVLWPERLQRLLMIHHIALSNRKVREERARRLEAHA